MEDSRLARRRFLQFLLASPLAAASARSWAGAPAAGNEPYLVQSAADAIDVFDFEAIARARLPPAHWGYLSTGVDGDATLQANREALAHYTLRVRRMVDVRDLDLSVSLLGTRWETPIVLSPLSSQRAFDPEGELATARAAGTRKHLQVLSTFSSTAVEDVNRARGTPVWYQLYPTDQWEVTKALVARARAAQCPALVLTVDLVGGSNRVALRRWRRLDTRDCKACHQDDPVTSLAQALRKPMFRDIDVAAVKDITPPDIGWDYVARLRGIWPRKLLLKGLVSGVDAELALQHGVDGIVVSNHGGRAEDSGRGSIDSLVEVARAVRGRVPLLVDGGFRRGSDILKALALGANAVCIGRPYAWGLASFGQAGVEAVLDLLRSELSIAMRQAGVRSIAELRPGMIVDARRPA
jgi:isopentenyl diphosphate isomerase/L-lactate dehydrogenase-like FMN-dependent dehydrogenase